MAAAGAAGGRWAQQGEGGHAGRESPGGGGGGGGGGVPPPLLSFSLGPCVCVGLAQPSPAAASPAMALVPGAEPAAGPSRWLPTHVQVTVLRARGLRGKSSGAGSTSDAYTVIQVGREKYSTSVVEKTPGCPEWREECSFELPPGALDGLLRAQEADAGPAPWAAGSAAACELVLTTMHRSLIGVDKFLGQATVALDKVFGAGRAQHTQ